MILACHSTVLATLLHSSPRPSPRPLPGVLAFLKGPQRTQLLSAFGGCCAQGPQGTQLLSAFWRCRAQGPQKLSFYQLLGRRAQGPQKLSSYQLFGRRPQAQQKTQLLSAFRTPRARPRRPGHAPFQGRLRHLPPAEAQCLSMLITASPVICHPKISIFINITPGTRL